MDNYSISTNYKLINNGETTKAVYTDKKLIEVDLKIKYISNIPFTIEIMLIDNFEQRFFEIKEGTQYLNDEIFFVNLPNSNNQFGECLVNIRVKDLSVGNHDLIFVIKNKEKEKNRSLRAYDFLRMAVIDTESDSSSFNKNEIISLNNSKETTFEIEPIIDKKFKNISCKVQFNISKIYAEKMFNDEYLNHGDNEIDFVIMVLENNRLLTINDKYKSVHSKSVLSKDVEINFKCTSGFLSEKDIVILVVPYPFLNVEKAQRYQAIGYNNICYYQYKFDKSVTI